MENKVEEVRQDRYVINTVLLSLTMLAVLFLILVFYGSRIDQQERLEVTQRYINFENQVQSFINENAALLTGFSAYVDTFEKIDDKVVYEYLGSLVRGREDYINNISIVKNTTIIWSYPREANKGAIGIDLALNNSQYKSVLYVKRTLQMNFSGPVELVQGGRGFIIRTPIIKDTNYWGIASIIIKEEKLLEMFKEYSEESKLQVAIYKKSSPDNIIFGNEKTYKNSQYNFSSSLLGEKWMFSIVPTGTGFRDHLPEIIAILVTGLLVSIYITYKGYRYFKHNEDMKYRNQVLATTAIRDKLTGLYNRDYLDIRITEEISYANKFSSPLSLIYFDLNLFKRVNDTHGHAYGDEVLKRIAQSVKKQLRKSDFLARWGGDEFTVLMTNTSRSGAERAAVKLGRALEELEHDHGDKVTASIGVAEYQKGESESSWFNRVDKALYYAKSDKTCLVCICDFAGIISCIKKEEEN